MLKKVLLLDNIIYHIAYIFLSIILVSVLLQVFFRYILGSPIAWTIELTRYCLVWLTFLGAYLGLRRGGAHISMSLVYNKFTKIQKWYIDLLGNASMLVFFIFMVRFGSRFSMATLQSRPDSFDFSMGVIYSILPLAGLLFSIHCIVEMMRLFINRKQQISGEDISVT